MCKNDTFYASKVPLKSDLNTPKIDVFGIFVHVSPTGIHRPPAKRAKMVENGHFCVSEHNVRMTLFVNFFVCALFEKRHVNFLCTCMKNNFTLSNMHVNFWWHTSSYNFASMTTFCDAHFRTCMSTFDDTLRRRAYKHVTTFFDQHVKNIFTLDVIFCHVNFSSQMHVLTLCSETRKTRFWPLFATFAGGLWMPVGLTCAKMLKMTIFGVLRSLYWHKKCTKNGHFLIKMSLCKM